jgi:hypothetical protein
MSMYNEMAPALKIASLDQLLNAENADPVKSKPNTSNTGIRSTEKHSSLCLLSRSSLVIQTN